MRKRTLLLAVMLATCALKAVAIAQTPPRTGLQVQPPVFRSGVYLVPVALVLEYNKKPWVGLTPDDIRVIFDKTELTPLEVAHDEQAAHHYTVFVQPPDSARDGKTHTLQVKVKRPNSRSWATLPMKSTLTLPKKDGNENR